MSHAPSDTLSRRHLDVRREMTDRGLDAIVVTALPNILYLTNFDGSAAIVVLTTDTLFFLTDARYLAAMTASRDTPAACPTLELIGVEGSYDVTLSDLLKRLGPSRIGFEAAQVSVSRHAALQARLGAPASHPVLVATEGIVERLRVRKDEYELGVLREGARRISEVADDVFHDVQPGRSEREIALGIDWRMRSAGFERAAFETIVASGPRAGLPHARPSERKVSEGDLVVLDFGGVYDSYCVDLTRTVSVGRASERSRRVYDAVLQAHDRALAAVAPGRSRFDVDAAARDALRAAGLAEAFGHGTGHGLGIEIHEDPRIAQRRADVDTEHEALETGMVFTIEPGAYFPDWGGVRIEDDVVVTDSGRDVLTRVTTALTEI